MSTGDSHGAGLNGPAPDNGAAPAGQSAATGEGARPRGRRFSDRRRPAGREAGAAWPGARRRPGAPAAQVPAAEALDAVTLADEEAAADGPAAPAPTEATRPASADPPEDAGQTGRIAPQYPAPWPVRGAALAAGSAGIGPEVAGPAGGVRPAGASSALDRLTAGIPAVASPPEAGPAAVGPATGSAPPAGPATAPEPPGEPAAAGPVPAAEPTLAAGSPHVFLVDASRVALSWARRRHLGLSSACGISVALAGCAAIWFSVGTQAGIIRGVAALWASYLVLAAGRIIAAQSADLDGTAAARRRAGPVTWLAALGSALAEAAVYGGIVVGAAAGDWPAAWRLGVMVLGLVAVRNVMTACSTPYGFSASPGSLISKITAGIVVMPAGGRILVVGLVAPIWGARTTLLVLVAWAISSVGYGLAGRPRADVAPEATGPDGSGPLIASPMLVRLRDDGALARGLGALVRGSLLPLPPAILGLAGVSVLAVLGLHGLPGALMIGPAIVMLVAAPGSANAHAGRLDWLVPVLLITAQVLYLAAVGEGVKVPGPVTFALVGALLLRYTDLACSRRPVLLAEPRRHRRAHREYGTELGWEGRLLFAGVAAAMGIATVGYLLLTVYLVGLVGAKVVRSCCAPEQDLR